MMNPTENDSQIAELLAEAEAVEAAVQEAVRDALLAHKRSGNTVVGWHNGRVEWVPADEIQVDLPPPDNGEKH